MKIRSIYTSGIVAILTTLGLSVASAQDEAHSTESHESHESHGKASKLIVAIHPVGDSEVNGVIHFEQTDDGVKVTAKITGLEANSEHAFHVHEFGDLTSGDATSAGSHFNPDGHSHALPEEEERHSGDLGNLKADSDGTAEHTLTVKNITLDGGTHGILGRAVIIHAKKDDGGQPTGNAGARIGAGVIGIAKDAMEADATKAK